MIFKNPLILISTMVLVLCFSITCSTDNNSNIRNKPYTDDTQSTDETQIYASSRTFVTSKIKPNKLDVSGKEFRVKRNPIGKGCFVYDPRTNFKGVERYLVWWAPSDDIAYPLNGPSKMVTPGLNWSRDEGVKAPNSSDVVEYIFKGKPLVATALRTQQSLPVKDTFTVKEYNIYREIINTPMSVSEDQALKNVANKYGVTVIEAKNASRKVQEILFRNKWFGSPDSEIRHASDWVK